MALHKPLQPLHILRHLCPSRCKLQRALVLRSSLVLRRNSSTSALQVETAMDLQIILGEMMEEAADVEEVDPMGATMARVRRPGNLISNHLAHGLMISTAVSRFGMEGARHTRRLPARSETS